MNYEIRVEAGHGGESSDNIYGYISSPIPKGVKSVDDPFYKLLSKLALDSATEIVSATSKKINLTFLIEEIKR